MDEEIPDLLCHQGWQKAPFLGPGDGTRAELGVVWGRQGPAGKPWRHLWAVAGERSGVSLSFPDSLAAECPCAPPPLLRETLHLTLSSLPKGVAQGSGVGRPRSQRASLGTINVAQMVPCPVKSLSPDASGASGPWPSSWREWGRSRCWDRARGPLIVSLWFGLLKGPRECVLHSPEET